MPTAFIRQPTFLQNRTVCGLGIQDYFAWLGGDDNLQITEQVDEADIVIQGEFLGLSSETLAQSLTERRRVVGPQGVDVVTHRGQHSTLEPIPLSPTESRRVVDMSSFSLVEAELRRRIALQWLQQGVQIIDTFTTYIDANVQLEAGAIIWPGVVLRGTTHIGQNSEIQIGCWIENTRVGHNAQVKAHSVCLDATIGDAANVGPMAHLRPGACLGTHVKVGNFVEIKKSVLESGAKASHLSYIGDAFVGADANIGAGTITCNYDGHGKHQTTVGPRAFIGSNTALVAPVKIGEGAIVGAGSTISKDVPEDALAVERASMRILAGKAPALHERNRLSAAKARQKK